MRNKTDKIYKKNWKYKEYECYQRLQNRPNVKQPIKKKTKQFKCISKHSNDNEKKTEDFF